MEQLIKIDNDRYINPDHIIVLMPTPAAASVAADTWILVLAGIQPLTIPSAVAEYLLTAIDVNDTFMDLTEENSTPPERPLISRIASYLQEHAEGSQILELESVFVNDANSDIKAAVNQLTLNGEARFGPTGMLFHASHGLPTIDW